MADKDVSLSMWLAMVHLAAGLRQLPPCPYLQGADRLEELSLIVGGLHRAVGIKGVDIVPLADPSEQPWGPSLRRILRTLQVEADSGRERLLSLAGGAGGVDVICMTRSQFTALLRPVQEPP